MKLLRILLFQVFVLASYTNTAKILLLSPLGSKSHLIAYMGMFESLTEVGHQLTVVSAYGTSKETKNVRHIILPQKYSASSFVTDIFAGGTSNAMIKLIIESPRMCVESLRTDIIQDLKKEQFDMILLSAFFTDCYLSLVHYFKVPFIYITEADILGPWNDFIGNIPFPSLAGNVLLSGTYPFGFIYRLKATLMDLAFNNFVIYYTGGKMESLCKEIGECPPDMASYQEIRANASLMIVNSVKLLHSNPIPDMPNIIYAGGSHCRPAKPLPQELDKWIQDSGDNGFIFFSLGSVVTPSEMPESARKIFINIFGKLKQRVLWKWDKEMDDLPSNVKLGKWLPQQDILAHPKMKLFITHGGLLSIMETTYHGALILGMPVFFDQFKNIEEALTEGWGDVLHWPNLTEELLEKKIYDILNNRHMDEILVRRSKIMRDLPRSPKEEVIYWIEYVLRHNGAAHIRSRVNELPWYILYNVDVWASLLAILLGSLAVVYLMLKAVIKRCFKKSAVICKKKKKQ